MSKTLLCLLLLVFLTASFIPVSAAELPELKTAHAELLNGGAVVSTFSKASGESVTLFGESFYESAYPKAYETILEGLRNLDATIDVADCRFPNSALAELYSDVVNSHADLFYVSFGEFAYRPDAQDNVIAIYPTYSEYATAEHINRFHEASSAVLSILADSFDEDTSEAEIALAVHDWLVDSCEYDFEHYETNTVPQLSYTSYGVFVNHVAVCNGYGTAYKYLLNAFGIDCEYIGSDAMVHGWNLVKIDGEWYHVDCTWDDPLFGNPLAVSHEHFLLSDAKIREAEHYGWEAPVIPSCTSNRFEQGYIFNGNAHAFRYRDGAFLFTTTEGLKRARIDGASEEILIDNSGLEQQLPDTYKKFHNTYFSDYGSIYENLVYGLCQLTKIEENGNGGFRISLDFGVRVYDLNTQKTEILATGLRSYDHVVLKDGVLSWYRLLLDEESRPVGTELLGSLNLYEAGYLPDGKIYRPLVRENGLVLEPTLENVQNAELLIHSYMEAPSTGKLLVCYYQDDVLVDLALIDIPLSAGKDTSVPLTHQTKVSYDTVRYMLWDFDSLRPFGDAVLIS